MTVCIYALNNLKSNSNKLLVTMCIGIGLALYGVYVQSRSSSNPSYVPPISSATHWLLDRFGTKTLEAARLMAPCKAKQMLAGGLLTRAVLKPALQFSGLINGFINIMQIVLLKLKYNDLRAAMAIGAMSFLGFLVSMVCLGGALSSCKMMCISCLGVHHLVIIYLSCCRYKLIKNMQCPPNAASQGNCTFNSSGGITGRIFGSSAANGQQTSGQPGDSKSSNSDVRRRRP